MIRLQLSSNEIKELSRLRNKTSDARSESALIILLSHQGLSVSEISEQIYRNEHTVRLWLKRYIKEGIKGLQRKYSSGRPPRQRMELLDNLGKWLSDDPSVYGYNTSEWTVSLIRDMFEKKSGKKISEDTVERALKRSDFSYRKAKKGVSLNAPSKEEKIERIENLIEEIKTFIGNEKANIISLDETHLSSEPYLIKGWYKKNSTYFTDAQEKGELYDFWSLEYQGTTIILEKRKKGKC